MPRYCQRRLPPLSCFHYNQSCRRAAASHAFTLPPSRRHFIAAIIYRRQLFHRYAIIIVDYRISSDWNFISSRRRRRRRQLITIITPPSNAPAAASRFSRCRCWMAASSLTLSRCWFILLPRAPAAAAPLRFSLLFIFVSLLLSLSAAAAMHCAELPRCFVLLMLPLRTDALLLLCRLIFRLIIFTVDFRRHCRMITVLIPPISFTPLIYFNWFSKRHAVTMLLAIGDDWNDVDDFHHLPTTHYRHCFIFI